VTSGASAAATGLGEAGEELLVLAVLEELHPLIISVAAVVALAVTRKLRLEIFDMIFSLKKMIGGTGSMSKSEINCNQNVKQSRGVI
jgi:hypothetical protein